MDPCPPTCFYRILKNVTIIYGNVTSVNGQTHKTKKSFLKDISRTLLDYKAKRQRDRCRPLGKPAAYGIIQIPGQEDRSSHTGLHDISARL